MKPLKIILSQFLLITMVLGIAELSFAQDDAKTQAIQLYNNAQELAGQNQFTDAISLYRDALEISRNNQLDDIADLIEERLPSIYATRASNTYKQFQSEKTIGSLDKAIQSFKESQDAAQEFGNNQIVQQAGRAIPQLYYVRSILNFKQQNYQASLEDLDTAIEMNPNYATAYYQKAVVLKNANPDDIDGFMAMFDKAIEVAQQINDTKTLSNAREAAKEELIYRAVHFSDNRQFQQATDLLNRVKNYDGSSDAAEYRLAEIANKRGRWSTAEEHARRALEYHKGGIADKAKIYFELGTALKGEGEFDQACSAFEDARYGEFTGPANHQLQFELKCKGHTATGM